MMRDLDSFLAARVAAVAASDKKSRAFCNAGHAAN
jgi:hypothetical protein